MKEILRLLRLLKPYSGWMLLGIFISLLALLANITLMAVSGWFIASMALAGAAGVSMNYFSPAAIIRASAIARTAGRYAERLVTHEATFRLLSELRVWFYHYFEPLVPAILDKYRGGDLFSRIQADIESLNDFYIRIMVPVAVGLLAISIVSFITYLQNSEAGLVLLGMLLVAGILLPVVIAKLSFKTGFAVVKQQSSLRTSIVDGVQGLDELIVSGAVKKQGAVISQASQQVIRSQRNLSRLSGFSLGGMTFLTGFTMWLIVILVIPMVEAGLLEPASLAMFTLLALAAFEAVIPLPDAFRLLGQVHMAARRLFELVDQQPLIREPSQPLGKPDHFHWVFDKLDFQYENSPDLVLKNINLDIASGKKIAIVGATGAGKSSLFQLLLKNRPALNGKLTLSGAPISDYHSDDINQWISVVPQQPYLFNTTILENIRLARPGASTDEIEKVLELAQLDDFVSSQPDGIHTWVGETGVRLSGGEAKRLAIARALIKDHELLLLDEPTEGLDAKTSETVLNNIFTQLADKSLVMITHQYTGLDDFDEVIVLENGKILERGKFKDLEKTNNDSIIDDVFDQ